MKTLIKILFLSFIICSCSNNDDSNNQNDSELILKEVSQLRESTSTSDFSFEKYHYREDGNPIRYEQFYENSTTNIRDTQRIYYNSDNSIDSIYIATSNFPGHVKYNYQNTELQSFDVLWFQLQPGTYSFTYNDNEIIMTFDSFYEFDNSFEQTKYTFNNSNYDLLISLVENKNNFTIKRDFTYDSNSNVTSIVESKYIADIDDYVIWRTKNFTYDDKINPYKNNTVSVPAILNNFGVQLFSFILQDNKISSNNILNITSNIPSSNTINVIEYEYEYNDLDYPISSVETVSNINNDNGSQDFYSTVVYKTYTYY
ncbi:hypothetical protein [Winogradskyella sp. MH6]|uniref:hypothetical protein n=1 Tax=Winogradskyella sp. MH6 TaxID=2929510 RepID=UPI001FB21A9F|nr:hypothetical protein [Winogradskyella sp. MH6]